MAIACEAWPNAQLFNIKVGVYFRGVYFRGGLFPWGFISVGISFRGGLFPIKTEVWVFFATEVVQSEESSIFISLGKFQYLTSCYFLKMNSWI